MSSAASLFRLLASSRLRNREQWLSPDELARLRASRLGEVAALADTTPHYREVFRRAGLRPADLTESNLAQLPLLDKAAIHTASGAGAAGPSSMLAEPMETLSPVTTSGSTGTPLRIMRSAADQAEVSAVWRRALRAFGHGTFDRQVDISSGQPVAKSGPVVLLRKLGLVPQIHYISSFDAVDDQIEQLRRIKPRTVSAYAYSLEVIAERMLERGITDIRPGVVFGAAMSLSDRGRELAERAFASRPFDLYVAAELGVVGWECPVDRDVLHLNDDVQIVEILDERQRPVPPGEPGEVVVTQLHTCAQPMLRYRLGDVAARLPGRCACGRGLGRLTRVQGRTSHAIRTPDGRMLFPGTVNTVVKFVTEVRRWQLREVSPGRLKLVVVAGDGWNESIGSDLARRLEEKIGAGLRFEVERVDDIPLAPSGKFQTVVPLARPAQPPAAS
jgi:phenylacetate-CoA ligase